MQLVDIGANLTHASFREDLDAVVSRAREAGVLPMVTGTSVAESAAALDIAERHGLHCTAGVHPHHARECGPSTIPDLERLAKSPRVVAIGECGLDFNRNYSPHPDQEKWFVAQLELGIALDKPLFLHSRDAHPRFSEIIASHRPRKAVAHCFTGEKDELHAYLELGLYVGITGWICDERRGRHLLSLVREIPRERLLLALPDAARHAPAAACAAQRAHVPAPHPAHRGARARPPGGRGGRRNDPQRTRAFLPGR